MSSVLRLSSRALARSGANAWTCLPLSKPPARPSLSTAQTSQLLRYPAVRELSNRNKYDEKAKDLSQKSLDEHEQQVKVKQNQIKRPWHREGADRPPAEELGRSSQPLSQGKLLTTPTRLLKLILPLPVGIEKDTDNNASGSEYGRAISPNDRIQPLALLVHPQQPLSYVERLIQAELPPVVEDGKEKVPNVYFRAEDTGNDENTSKKDKDQDSAAHRSNVATYSGLGREGPKRAHDDKNWVRWSSSTEVGDFIRDAARGREFVIEVEGHGLAMRVGVPSFNDRTYYMRVRLRKMAREIDALAAIKRECDLLAHRGAHRLAKGGFVLLAGWWGVVYYLTFLTDWGWDLVEPMTYLMGLTTIMGGYLWFLYVSRNLSYKAAMNLTVSRRQSALYQAKGFDMNRWEHLVQEANALRREIKTVATEYDVDWNEEKDVGEEVKEVLQKERSKKGAKSDDEDEDDDDVLEEKAKDKEEGKEKKP